MLWLMLMLMYHHPTSIDYIITIIMVVTRIWQVHDFTSAPYSNARFVSVLL